MAEYSKLINLIKVADGEKGESITIISKKATYQISNSGTVTPSGTWTEIIPDITQYPGQFLWTKTEVGYSDGTSVSSFSISYIAKDGERGPQGVPGENVSAAYYLEANQPSILKFQQNGNIIVSPEILNLNIYKANSSEETGREQVGGLSIDNLTIKVFSNLKGAWYEVPPLVKQSIVTLNELGNTFNVDLKSYYEMSLDSDDKALFTFIDEDCIFSFSYVLEIAEEDKNEKYNLSIYIDCNFAMTKDMVEFSQNAADITASIQSTKLKFSANGLEVTNGGIQIKDNNGTQVLYADENGNLIIKGILDACGGSFSGDISAASGNFSGTINGATGNFAGDISAATGIFKGGIQASEGLIGGFKITQDSLISTDNEANPAITLNGITGKIVAQNIELGTGAIIKEYIQLGSGKVTLNNSSKFLTVRKNNSSDSVETLSINDEGVIVVGNGDDMITIDGGNGIIKSQSYDSGLGWKISSLESIFNDVTVRGSIRASVLEYGEVQTIGGALIVRPSSRIKNIEENNNVSTIFVEDSTGFNIDDWCLINKDLEKVWVKILDVAENILTIEQKLGKEYIGHPIVNFGKTGSIGIGINGSTSSSLIEANSLSVFEFDEDNKNKPIPRIILGRLPDDGYGFASGTYGLYAENVLLKGSLVTSTVSSNNETVVYSGISTLYSGSNSPTSHGYKEYFGENTGEILLWAGAASTSKNDVEESKFFVDKNGNLVAKSGYFKGTIITDAQITASEIITAKLTGNGSGPALTISDAALGIVFQKTDKTTQTTSNIFVLSEDSITANVPSIVFNDNFKIKENGEVVISKAFMGGFSFTEGRINYSDSFSDTDLDGSIRAYIDFSNGIKLSPDNVKNSMVITATQVEINDITRFSNTIKYGVNDNMKYEPVYDNDVLIGYDLYVD